MSFLSPVCFCLLSPISCDPSPVSSPLSPEYKAHCLKGRDTRFSTLLLRRVCREVCWHFDIWCHVNTNLFKIRRKWNQRNQILDKFNSVLEPNSCETLSTLAETRDDRVGDSKRCFFSRMSLFCSFCLIKMEKVISGEREMSLLALRKLPRVSETKL